MANQLDNRRLQTITEALLSVGYDHRALVSNYDFAVKNGHDVLDHIDLVAFSDPVRHDLQTSCIAIQHLASNSSIGDALRKFAFLATPLALIAMGDFAELWPVTVTKTDQSRWFERIPYDRLTQYFHEHAQDLRPEALIGLKTKGAQLSFFDLDSTLLEFAHDATQRILVDRFEMAVEAAREALRGTAQPQENHADRLTKAALQLLAASILEDKRLLSGQRSRSADELINRAARNYSQYFDPSSVAQIGQRAAESAYMHLRRNVTFRSFTNEMLGYFYENAFVNQKLRKELSIYYTPRAIARRMLARLPIEDIPPSQRTLFDGSCGSGNFLLAGYERLADLLPRPWDREHVHRYLVERIHGVDVDRFATQVAGLSLFLINLPNGDAWDVQASDFVKMDSARLPGLATILVGNPPFREYRSQEGKRLQRASRFLERYLDLLGPKGLLGVVLPETFLENSSCKEVRRRLLSECDLLELWHLPEGIFPMSNAATVVILARKWGDQRPSQSTEPVRIEKVASLPEERRGFLDGADPRFSYIVPSSSRWVDDKDALITSSPFWKSVWNVVRYTRRVGDVADVRNGIIPGAAQHSTHFADRKIDAQWRPWLSGTRDFEPHLLKQPAAQTYVKYPGSLLWPRLDLEPIFARPSAKVLVNSNRAPGNPWRLYAAIDTLGFFPSQGIHCVVPKVGAVTLQELSAFLNSPIASAWIDGQNRSRWIKEEVIRRMPFPDFADVKDVVIRNVDRIMELKREILSAPVQNNEDGLSSIRRLLVELDQLVYVAFGLGEDARKKLSSLFAGYRRPGAELADAVPAKHGDGRMPVKGRKWVVTGQVMGVLGAEEQVVLWVRGYNDGQLLQVPIPATMPGWALREEAAFQVEIPWEKRHSVTLPVASMANFRPLEFSHSMPEELIALLHDPTKLVLSQRSF